MAQRRYDHEQWARQQFREDQRQQRADLAAQKAAERERKQAAIETGKATAAQLTETAAGTLDQLTSILRQGLDRRAAVDLATCLRRDRPPALDLHPNDQPAPPPRWEDFAPAELGVLGGIFGGRARHDRRVAEARVEFKQAQARYEVDKAAQQRWANDETARHHAAVRQHQMAVDQHNQEIEAIRSGLATRDRENVEAYLELVLARIPLPTDVPHQVEVAYSPRGEQAVVRFELPPADAIPAVATYTFVSTTEEMREKKRSPVNIQPVV